ncbi:hypothetical protein ACJJTC_001195 [Scirpophaga incertulas]
MNRFLLSKQVGSSNGSDKASTSGGGEAKKRKYRKYDDSYLDFGFTSIEVNNEEKPQCVLCLKILSSECMLPSNNTHILKLSEKIAAFRKKLQLWITKLKEGGGQDCFPQLYNYAASNELVVSQDLITLFTEHLAKLTEYFSKYFADDDVEKFAWIQDPFHAQSPQGFTSQDEESLIELSCDSSLKTRFASVDLVEFCLIPRFEKLCGDHQAHPSH